MKNKNYSAALLLFGIVLLSTHITSAQLSKGPRAELAAITRTNPATGWIYFKDNLQLTPEALFHQHKQAFALKADDEMRFDRSMEMHLTGMQQYKYQQYYKNIKVHGAVANLYLKDGIVVKANGRLVHDLHKNIIRPLEKKKHWLQRWPISRQLIMAGPTFAMLNATENQRRIRRPTPPLTVN
ncbi:MAG: hypothetical protein IPM91_01325 [Bacteroidetes bacterium]|nr:hypothetical protein [Bacteroidota bacterium]